MISFFYKKIVKGVSWKHPLVRLILSVLNPLDWTVRKFNGHSAYPKMSIRVRSNGLRGQFDGSRFAVTGQNLAKELMRHAKLTQSSKVLEIGCGCGRNAFALAPTLGRKGYAGIDIDKPSIVAAQKNAALKKLEYEFEYLNIHNAEYNPDGEYAAHEYKFNFADESFDLIFLVSVFTHMLPKDIENYIKEISRMLKPNGKLIFTTFIMDESTVFGATDFKYEGENYRSSHAEIPEICVGYYTDFIDHMLGDAKMERLSAPILSETRGGALSGPTTPFTQDIIIAGKA